MSLAVYDDSHQPDGPDWQWNGLFKPGASSTGFQKIEGIYLDLINPELQVQLQGRAVGKPTYTFHTSELCLAGAVLYEQLAKNSHSLATITTSNSFPYKSVNGVYGSIITYLLLT